MAAYGLLAAWPFLLLHPPFTDPPMAANFCFSGVHTSRSPSYTEFMLIVSGCFSATNSQDEADFWEAKNGIWVPKLKRGLSINTNFSPLAVILIRLLHCFLFPSLAQCADVKHCQIFASHLLRFWVERLLLRNQPIGASSVEPEFVSTAVTPPNNRALRHLQFYWIHKSRARPMTVV